MIRRQQTVIRIYADSKRAAIVKPGIADDERVRWVFTKIITVDPLLDIICSKHVVMAARSDLSADFIRYDIFVGSSKGNLKNEHK